MSFIREQWKQIRGNLKYDILKAMAIASVPWLLSEIFRPPVWAMPLGVFLTSLGLLLYFDARRVPNSRTLSGKQKARLLRTLGTRRASIAIDSITNDVEALGFARQLAGVFAEAGWEVAPPKGATRLTTTRVGVVLFFNRPQSEIAAFVETALSKNGIDCVSLDRERENEAAPPQLVVASRAE